MSQNLIVSDELYGRLETTARQRGLRSVEQLLEIWQGAEEERAKRTQAVQQIDAVRLQLFGTYGEMPDSLAFLHEDRER